MAVFSDNFNRANGALEVTPVSSGGGSWVHDGAIANAAQVNANVLRCNTTNSAGSAYSAGSRGSLDHFVEFAAPVATQSTGSFFCCRMTDRNNFLGVRAGNGTSNGQIEVYIRLGGVITGRWGSAGSLVAQGDIVRLEVEGPDFRVYKNGVLVHGPTAINDGGALTSQNTGIVARIATGSMGDNFNTDALDAGEAAITGTMAASESGSDTFSGTGAVFVSGSMAAAESGADVFAGAGTPRVTGSMAAAESGADTFAGAGATRVTGSMEALEEGADDFTATGQTFNRGTMAASETGADTFAASGSIPVTGSMAAQETSSDLMEAYSVLPSVARRRILSVARRPDHRVKAESSGRRIEATAQRRMAF